MSDIGAILRLQRVAAALLAGEMPPVADAIEHGAALACFLERTCRTLDAACEVASGAGEMDVRNVLALAERSLALVEGVRICGSAAAFARRIAHYRSTAWLRDRRRDNPPTDEIKAICWRVLRARDATLSAARIRQVLREIRSRYSFPFNSRKVST